MHTPQSIRRAAFLGLALFTSASALQAAPQISRLTPPSALFSFNDANPPIIARFLPGQRFDLQATVQPDVGETITGVVFKVDGNVVPGSVALTTTGLVTPLPPLPPLAANTAVASLRAYSNLTPGVHTFTAEATQSGGGTVTATGNFEVVPITNQGRKAKNIIIMIGDGMGASHRTAARIMLNGVQQGKANAQLSMDKFPVTAMINTASLNSIVADSSPGAACYSTGNKSNNNQQGCFPDDTTANFDNPRVELIGEYLARTQGKALGIVTTADVFDATPGAFGTHTQNRGAGTGICDQYLDEAATKGGLKVLLGGGRKWFLPNTTLGSARGNSTDYVLPADLAAGWAVTPGVLDPARDLISDFQAAGFAYAPDKTSMAAVPANAQKLLGLFTLSNMNIAKDKIDGRRAASTVVGDYRTDPTNPATAFNDQPMLDEMTDKALQVLNNNPNGFVLMVEAASIDKQAHNMDTERWILDTIEFDYAIEKARQFALNPANGETLVIITADHECAGVAIIGASRVTNASLVTRSTSGAGTAAGGPRNGVVGTYDAAGFPQYTIAADGYPTTTDPDFKMLIGYAANADRYEDWLTNPLPLRDSQQPFNNIAPLNTYPNGPLNRDVAGGYLVTGQVEDVVAAHTAGDIPLAAIGRGAKLFGGTMDNTEVFFRTMQAAIGGAAN
jgi:alkaline phosphatase